MIVKKTGRVIRMSDGQSRALWSCSSILQALVSGLGLILTCLTITDHSTLGSLSHTILIPH